MTKAVFKSFPVAMLSFFGKKDGQDNKGFMEELKDLTTEDREYFTKGLAQNDIVIDATGGAAVSAVA